MKPIRAVLILFFVLCAAECSAQFTIRRESDPRAGIRELTDSVRPAPLYNPHVNPAAVRELRRRQRRQRNAVELGATLQTSMQQFENWTAGGNNTFSIISTLYFRHQYKRDKYNLDYGITARYGMNLIDSKLFKNVDEFKINLQTGWDIRRSWSYSTTFNLRSQFTTGYYSRDDKTKISSFMSPGFIDLAVGFTYANDRSPFKITLSPVGGNLVTMLDDAVPSDYKDKDYRNGVDPGRRIKSQIGPSVNVFFDKTFGKKEIIRYRSNLYGFTNFRTTPTVRWENNIDIRVGRLITTNLYGLAYYLKDASTALQLQYAFTIGLAYKFNNK